VEVLVVEVLGWVLLLLLAACLAAWLLLLLAACCDHRWLNSNSPPLICPTGARCRVLNTNSRRDARNPLRFRQPSFAGAQTQLGPMLALGAITGD